MITTFVLSLSFYEYVLNVQWAQNPGRREKKYIVRSVTIYNYHLILLG